MLDLTQAGRLSEVPVFGNFHKWLTSPTASGTRRAVFSDLPPNLAVLPMRTLPPLNSDNIRGSKCVSKTISLDPY